MKKHFAATFAAALIATAFVATTSLPASADGNVSARWMYSSGVLAIAPQPSGQNARLAPNGSRTSALLIGRGIGGTISDDNEDAASGNVDGRDFLIWQRNLGN